MGNNDQHIDFYNQLKSPFEQSDDELWDKIEKRIDEQPKAKTVRLHFYRYAASAAILLLFGTGLLMKFYTTTVRSQKGDHLSHSLPDGSTVELNAETTLAYQPYWWRFNREVSLSGEAFFEVEKGKTFRIVSENGITEVLGTSFNVYARNTDYKVFCKTGQVRVTNTKSTIELIINPGELAALDHCMEKGYINKAAPDHVLSWKDNKFAFTSEQLHKVIQELERQYDVSIELALDSTDQLLYTGYFNKAKSVEPTLNIICKSFNLTFKRDNNGYKIYPMN